MDKKYNFFKSFFSVYIFGVFCSILLLYIFSITVDPYGLISNQDKNVEDLTTQDSFVMSAKIKSQTRYFLLGTSRSLRIDPLLPQKYLHAKVTHLGFHGQSISQWNLILKEIQKRNVNIILGFDSFSINQYYDEYLNLGVKLFEEAVNKNSTFYFLHKIFIEKIIFYSFAKNQQKRSAILQCYDAEKNTPYTLDDVAFFIIGQEKGGGKNYSISKNKLNEFISYLKDQDIIILFPKYYFWYQVFFQAKTPLGLTIQEQYFNAIKKIVEQTNAKVWSFYGINSITLNKDNFDNLGQHFKPKIAPLIFARIFHDKTVDVPKDFGILLTKENIDQEFEKIKRIEKQYFQD